MKNIWILKDTIKKMKRQPTERKKIFANHISDKGLKLHKEFLQHNNYETMKPVAHQTPLFVEFSRQEY